MKEDIAMRWVEELRSGKYKQGRQHLKREINGETQHCCLGVLCELFTDDGGWEAADLFNVGAQAFNVDGKPHAGIPPQGVVERAGLNNATCWLPADKELKIAGRNYTSLTEANDTLAMTFTDIADFIQKNWEQL